METPAMFLNQKTPNCKAAAAVNEDKICSAQFSSVVQSCPTLCDPMNRSTAGLRVHPQLPEFTQTHIR